LTAKEVDNLKFRTEFWGLYKRLNVHVHKFAESYAMFSSALISIVLI